MFPNPKSLTMFNFKKKPHNLLLTTAVIIFIASFFVFDHTLDIHIHDTYFIISASQILWAIVILLLVFWILYLLTTRILFSKVLTWVHIILAVLTSISFVAISFYSNYQGKAGTPRRYYDYSNWETTVQFDNLTKVVAILFSGMVLGLFIYVVNLGAGVIKKITGRRTNG